MSSSAGLPLEQALARAVEGAVGTVLNSTNSPSLCPNTNATTPSKTTSCMGVNLNCCYFHNNVLFIMVVIIISQSSLLPMLIMYKLRWNGSALVWWWWWGEGGGEVGGGG